MKLFKIYLKREWWFGPTWAIPVVFMAKGYVYPELRFKFDFIFEVETYGLLVFYHIMWTIIWFYFLETLLYTPTVKEESI
jgi:hypothetical protein